MRANRTLILVAALVTVAIVLGWFMLIFRPKGDELSDVRAEVDQAVAEEQTLRASLGRLEEIDADRPALEAELQRLHEAVPAQPELGSLLLAAHDMAARAGVAFVSITPAPPAASDGLNASVVSLGMEAEGRYFAVLDFVNRLEDLDRMVVIDSMTLSRVEEQDEDEGASAAGEDDGELEDDGASVSGVDDDHDPVPPATGDPVDDDEIPQPPPDPHLISHTAAAPATTSTTSPSASIASFDDALDAQVNERLTVTLQIQARAFTTAPPFADDEGGGGGGTPTTTTTVATGGAATPPPEGGAE